MSEQKYYLFGLLSSYICNDEDGNTREKGDYICYQVNPWHVNYSLTRLMENISQEFKIDKISLWDFHENEKLPWRILVAHEHLPQTIADLSDCRIFDENGVLIKSDG
jgi:hypothetical protein